MSNKRDKMDELFPDFEAMGRFFKRLAWIALGILITSIVLSVACGR